MYFKLEVGAFMCDNKGNTLIESLLAFEIFITVIVVYVTLMGTLISRESRLDKNYNDIQERELKIEWREDFVSNVEMALH